MINDKVKNKYTKIYINTVTITEHYFTPIFNKF